MADYVEQRDSTDSDDLGHYITSLADEAEPWQPPADSFRAPIERGLARNEFPQPVPASALGASSEVSWVWEGFIARGFVTLLTGLWKAGKTTLLGHLLQALDKGTELAVPTTPSRVLVVAEETGTLWARRRDDLGIGDHAEFDVQPFLGRPSQDDWEGYLMHLTALVTERRYRLVIFDTLASFSPVIDENDASRMMTALTPLRMLTQEGAAVLLVHHPRKGDAGEGQASRGSGALPGFVDVILELRRFDPGNRQDTRRVLTAYSRFDETPQELVLELTPEGYRGCGSRSEATQQSRFAAIEAILPDQQPGLTAEEVRARWPEEELPMPGKRTVETDLKAGAKSERWRCAGAGRKGDPYRYHIENAIRARSHSIGARNESGQQVAEAREAGQLRPGIATAPGEDASGTGCPDGGEPTDENRHALVPVAEEAENPPRSPTS